MEGYGYRLDCSPYLGGALETKVLLEKLLLRKDPLHTLTTGFDGGIYNGPKFSRTWVESPEYGVPFVGGSAMLYADLSDLPLLSKKQAHGRQLRHLELQPGMSLISCSGTIGKMVYARADMAGIWSSQHILKVVADPAKVPSGYLYAYLSSKFGIPLMVSGTYGSIIQSLGPNNIKDVPVPRLGDALEHEIHSLVEEAATLRAKAIALRRDARRTVESALDWKTPSKQLWRSVESPEVIRRVDAHFHSFGSDCARAVLAAKSKGKRIRDFAVAIFCPDRGAREKVDSAEFGVPFLSSSDVFHVAPTAEFLISRRTRNFQSFILSGEDVLLPRSGSLGGVIGRAVLPLPNNYNQAGSDHLIRVRCRSVRDAHYLWAILASKPGYVAVLGTAFGSAIPSLDAQLVGDLDFPALPDKEREKITDQVSESVQAAGRAMKLEDDARELLVRTLEAATDV
jgi:type I restriction enzyme S subunit